MEEAVSAQATRLKEKLPRGRLGTTHVTVSHHTSEHDRRDPMRSVSTTVTLPEPTNDTLALIKVARADMAKKSRASSGDRPWRFSKAGIITTDLASLEDGQRALFGQLDRERSGPLMAARDKCNRRFGRGGPSCRRGLVLRRSERGRPNSRCAARATRRKSASCRLLTRRFEGSALQSR